MRVLRKHRARRMADYPSIDTEIVVAWRESRFRRFFWEAAIWQSGQACPRWCEQIVIIDTMAPVLRDKMWQDKDDTCLIVRGTPPPPDDRPHQNAPRLFSTGPRFSPIVGHSLSSRVIADQSRAHLHTVALNHHRNTRREKVSPHGGPHLHFALAVKSGRTRASRFIARMSMRGVVKRWGRVLLS